MADPEEIPPAADAPDIETFVTGSTEDLGQWRWLWRGDHPFPVRSHRGRWGRVVVAIKRLFRPLVRAPQADLWERQRIFNLVLISHLQELARLRGRLDALGDDLQRVQGEILRDLRAIQADYIRGNEHAVERLENLEVLMGRMDKLVRQGLLEVMGHHDALFSRLDQKLDRLRRSGEG
ncbi:MAG: hypothetical protein R3325_14415 [Thermoanaerobaculia bacterium]|nr:hypothetical protein [Thermoanaerobaculia bacterium]